jgi:predicted MPP superfamily phosphohydrolase
VHALQRYLPTPAILPPAETTPPANLGGETKEFAVADWITGAIQHVEGLCASAEQNTFAMMFVGACVTGGNALVWRALYRRLRGAFPRVAWQWWVAPAAVYWALALPMLVLAVGGASAGHWMQENLPAAITISCMAFQFFVWVYGGVLLLGLKSRLLARGAIQLSGRMPDEPADVGRRDLLKRAALGVPAAIITTAAVGAVGSQQTPVVNRIRLRVQPDYSALRGLRIAQFSDVHIGSYLERDRLAEIADCVNSLRPDIAVCTGDLIDNQVEQLEHGQRLLRGLSPRIGTFMCMGNHEYIAAQGDERGVRDGLKEGGATLLVDQSIKLPVHGTHLWLAGTDFPGTPGGALGDRPSTGESLDRALADMRDDGAPRIVLSHHPKTFFEGRERQIDLMLSGHTHGGQISLGRIDDYALTPNLPFEFYHKGLYEHDGRRLYVNSGIGSWLPVRLNCPPEITLIELV